MKDAYMARYDNPSKKGLIAIILFIFMMFIVILRLMISDMLNSKST